MKNATEFINEFTDGFCRKKICSIIWEAINLSLIKLEDIFAQFHSNKLMS